MHTAWLWCSPAPDTSSINRENHKKYRNYYSNKSTFEYFGKFKPLTCKTLILTNGIF